MGPAERRQHVAPPPGLSKTVGTREGLISLGVKDIKQFRIDNYEPINAILTIQSSHNSEEILRLCETYLASWKYTQTVNPQSPLNTFQLRSRPVALMHAASGSRIAVNHSDNQFTLRLSFALTFAKGSRKELDHAPKLQSFELLERILDDGTASRLQSTIRETLGLVYTISASMNEYQNAMTFDIEATVAPEHLIQTYEEVLRQIELLKSDLADPTEVYRAVTRAKFELERLAENHRDYLERLVDAKFENLDYNEHQRMQIFNEIKPLDIQHAAQELFQMQNYALVLVGPNAEKWIGKLRTLC